MTQMVPQTKSNAPAIASLVLGVLATLAGLPPIALGGYAAAILGVLGFALGMDGLRKVGTVGNGRGIAIAGIVLCVVGVALGLLMFVRLAR